MELVFEWDPHKERTNRQKHGISFSEAASVFRNPLARIFADQDHSFGERREIIVGHSQAKRLLLVSFVEPEEGWVRIINARRATKKEHVDYEDNTAP